MELGKKLEVSQLFDDRTIIWCKDENEKEELMKLKQKKVAGACAVVTFVNWSLEKQSKDGILDWDRRASHKPLKDENDEEDWCSMRRPIRLTIDNLHLVLKFFKLNDRNYRFNGGFSTLWFQDTAMCRLIENDDEGFEEGLTEGTTREDARADRYTEVMKDGEAINVQNEDGAQMSENQTPVESNYIEKEAEKTGWGQAINVTSVLEVDSCCNFNAFNESSTPEAGEVEKSFSVQRKAAVEAVGHEEGHLNRTAESFEEECRSVFIDVPCVGKAKKKEEVTLKRIFGRLFQNLCGKYVDKAPDVMILLHPYDTWINEKLIIMRNLVFQKPEVKVTDDVTTSLSYNWDSLRVSMIAPLLNLAMTWCSVMSIMLFIEQVYMAMSIKEAVELDKSYPLVNRLSMEAACGISWPADRLIIQVLDDSTNEVLRELVEMECHKWMEKGENINCKTRNNRNGYKAGALKEGLEKQYVKTEFVAIFDAYFQPEEDFLWRTIPYLLENPDIGLVHARWKFWEMSLDYHFNVEQEVGSSTCSFFGFNSKPHQWMKSNYEYVLCLHNTFTGTASLWRIQAIKDAGGWKDRTTVEDMDLFIISPAFLMPATLFLTLPSTSILTNLCSYFARLKMNYQVLLRHIDTSNTAGFVLEKDRCVPSYITQRVSIWKRLHLIYAFFFKRKIVAHWVTFFFYCIVIPTIVVPEVQISKPLAVYTPASITILNAVSTSRSLNLVVFWILFENVMSIHLSKATIIGLLQANWVDEWAATEKLGNTVTPKSNLVNHVLRKPRPQTSRRIHVLELLMGMFMLCCAVYNLLYKKDHFFFYLLLQAGDFFIMALGH
ncbi:hypothetical protein G4B88_008044, partial [Cannabis sativa]